MKKLSLILTVLGVVVFSAFSLKNEPLAIGEKAPMSDLKMIDISDESLSLEDLKKENGLLIIYSCNTCPFVVAWEDRYPALGDFCKTNNIGMVLVNSNEAKRAGDDSMEAMKTHAAEKGYNTPYVLDKDSQLANAMGAKTTPHVFLFDNELALVYRGAIDDNYKNKSAVKKPYLNEAIEALAQKKTINPNETKALGCSIKRIKI